MRDTAPNLITGNYNAKLPPFSELAGLQIDPHPWKQLTWKLAQNFH